VLSSKFQFKILNKIEKSVNFQVRQNIGILHIRSNVLRSRTRIWY